MGWDQAETGMEGDSGELFAATKGAIMAFTRSLALSLAPTVRVNALAPGWIKTEWGEGASQAWQDRVLRETPMARWGTPEDVAQVARFLVSPAAGVPHRTDPAGQRRGGPLVDARSSGRSIIRESVGETAVRSWSDRPRYLFVTGRLAEFALRQVLDDLAPRAGFSAEVAVLPISVAALMTPEWVARHLEIPEGIDRIILPGYCGGDLGPVVEKARGFPVEQRARGPQRPATPLRPRRTDRLDGYGAYSIEILAEINHAPRLSIDELIAAGPAVPRSREPTSSTWAAIPARRWDGCRGCGRRAPTGGACASRSTASTRSRSPTAAAAGAELVLSVHAEQPRAGADWGVEVVAIPDQPGTLEGLDETVEFLDENGVPFRIDPIIEPIGFGFAASLGRYLEVRRTLPRRRR